MSTPKEENAGQSPEIARTLVDPRTGYDLAASVYDSWSWQRFWQKNETPAIDEVRRPLNSARVLDVGAGTGRYFELIRAKGHEVYGIDVSPNMLSVAAMRFGKEDFKPFLRVGDVCDIPFGDR